MEIPLIKIGNSRGIRLSSSIIKKYKIVDKVELVEKDDCIVLMPAHEPRENWDEAFRIMHLNNDDVLLIDDVFDDEILEAWS
ncbi:MAG: AbrB/MazE/SpoVT family DNA-binding domain-containing protein [Bacteroidales bacterium]|nr:AbrB/MazE/SpoVT family DNA-binding domain-containing protein [Bacteroidales bacterium]MDZ4203298.1 AbrB/MazE/SpoVT family DNA-binding domain-containing protein [Bacteroidales bacterium]